MSHSTGSHKSNDLVYKLVCHIIRKPADSVKAEYRNALQILNCAYDSYDTDEFTICEKIKKQFMVENRVKDAVKFVELHRSLQTSAVLKNRARVLQFLLSLQGSANENVCRLPNAASNLFSSDQDLTVTSHEIINKQINKSRSSTVELSDLQIQAQSKDSSSESQHLLLDPVIRSRINTLSTLMTGDCDQQIISCTNGKQDHNHEKALIARSDESNLGSICLTVPNLKLLLRDILYVVQGLRGDVIYWEPDKNNFNVVFKEDFPNPLKRLTLRFIEMGWMYCRINQYCKAQTNERSLGLIAQSFITALNERLVTYYKLLAELEAFLTQDSTLEEAFGYSNSLTMHRLSVWFFEPHTQLKILASVVDACKGKKGGSLASVLYSHLQHGDYYVRTLIQSLLKSVSQPLLKMISNWIYCGELEDAFGEFFVATNIAVPDCSLWQERYSLNKAMIPSFITMEQARKILSSGKAINFLRQVCQDNTFVRDEDKRMKALNLMSIESFFSQEKDANFENILEKNYVKTSKAVLQILHDKYNLMDHLLAMRNYLLLGQGDFIRHLMDLLDEDLAKPANSLYIHNLTGILESAIRATNAQFHNPEVLQRLDVRLLEVSIGDKGWDVFSLDYHVDGPIGTVFTPYCMNSYLRLFNALWRAKRMEYVLSKISHSRTTYLKLQEKIPEVTPIVHSIHVILAQMVHFVQQMQYYMAFEVMECCWADLLLKISSAQDLDEVINGHEDFIDTLLTRALLDEESAPLRTQLQAVYDSIIMFDVIQSDFWNEVNPVAAAMEKLDEQMQLNTNKGTWGSTEDIEGLKMKLETRYDIFRKKQVPRYKANIKVVSKGYENLVQQFLLTLMSQDDPNLRFLSFRLDFNEHFKNRDSRLQTSLRFQRIKKEAFAGSLLEEFPHLFGNSA